MQTFAVALDYSLAELLRRARHRARRGRRRSPTLELTIAQVAPILPYLLLVLILIFRPQGLLGTRET